MSTRHFWRNKKVLITGYEGFLGSNLTKTLLDCGARVTGLDILTHRKETLLSKEDFKKINIIKGSVENFSLVLKIIKNNKIEVIFHLAAKSLVGDCYRNPLKCFSTNVEGTWNILEASRKSSFVKATVIASSDKAYGIKNKLPYKENFSLNGCHPYDASKSCADLLASAYYHTFKLPVCVTRCGNIFGPGDFNFSRIVPDTIRSMINDETLIIRSDGKFTRDYIYVKDVVLAYMTLAEKMLKSNLSGEAFNFSNEKPVSVLQLVKTIYKVAGKKPNYKITNQAKSEIKYQYLDAGKARKILGWKPVYDLEGGLLEAFEWYKEFLLKK